MRNKQIIFRGFLFKALYNDNVKLAIVILSVTFGIGHIVNLLNGKDLIPTLLQVCSAKLCKKPFILFASLPFR